MFEDDESHIGKLDETEESWETSEGSGEGDADDAIVRKRRRERRRTHADPEPTQRTERDPKGSRGSKNDVDASTKHDESRIQCGCHGIDGESRNAVDDDGSGLSVENVCANQDT